MFYAPSEYQSEIWGRFNVSWPKLKSILEMHHSITPHLQSQLAYLFHWQLMEVWEFVTVAVGPSSFSMFFTSH